MKNFQYFDILAIVILAGAFSGITYFEYSKLLSQYILVITLIAYYLGKYPGKTEVQRKQNEQ